MMVGSESLFQWLCSPGYTSFPLSAAHFSLLLDILVLGYIYRAQSKTDCGVQECSVTEDEGWDRLRGAWELVRGLGKGFSKGS